MIEPELVVPAEGRLLVKFLDEDDEEKYESATGKSDVPYSPVPYEGCLAQVIAAGPKTTSKRGQIVITSHWARDGMKIGDACLICQFDVVGTLKS